MRRRTVSTGMAWVWLAAGFAAPAQNSQTLEQAARNPQQLARFVEANPNLDWDLLVRTLRIQEPQGPACSPERRCFAELLAILDPPQTIVHLSDGVYAHLYLRYRNSGSGNGWVYSGHATAVQHNHPQRSFVERHFGGKPFLHLTSQGHRGSDIDSLSEVLYDLSLPDFKPVFWYLTKGHERRHGLGISRTFAARLRDKAPETLELSVDVTLEDPGKKPLADLRYTAVYSRQQQQQQRRPAAPLFRLQSADRGDTAVPAAEFENLLHLDPGPSNQELIRLAMPALRKIAKGGREDDAAKGWLRSVLDHCCGAAPPIPEVRELRSILSSSASGALGLGRSDKNRNHRPE